MLRTLFKKSVVWDPGSPVSSWGHLILRVSAGLMLFYIHGWHSDITERFGRERLGTDGALRARHGEPGLSRRGKILA